VFVDELVWLLENRADKLYVGVDLELNEARALKESVADILTDIVLVLCAELFADVVNFGDAVCIEQVVAVEDAVTELVEVSVADSVAFDLAVLVAVAVTVLVIIGVVVIVFVEGGVIVSLILADEVTDAVVVLLNGSVLDTVCDVDVVFVNGADLVVVLLTVEEAVFVFVTVVVLVPLKEPVLLGDDVPVLDEVSVDVPVAVLTAVIVLFVVAEIEADEEEVFEGLVECVSVVEED